MSFSIKGRLMILGALAIAGLLVQLAITLVTGGLVADKGDQAQDRVQAVRHVRDMQTATLRLMFTAMDSLVDRADGTVNAERRAAIAEAAAVLRAEAGQITALADTPEEKALAKEAAASVEPLIKGIETDMVAMIQRHASDDELAGLDDVIDGHGEAMIAALQKYEASMRSETDQTFDALHGTTVTARNLTIATFVLGMGIMGFLTFAIIRSVVVPLHAMSGAMRRLAQGDTTVEIPARDRKDEVGEMAGAVEVFKDNKIEGDRLAAIQASEQEAKEARARRVETLISQFDEAAAAALNTVAGAARQLESTAQAMSATATQTSQQAGIVANASDLASANVQTVAAAAEELSSSIAEISRQVSQSTAISAEAVAEAQRSDAQVRSLAEAAGRIGEVVQLINDIASQTNLLALNATIEAARAGEAGKGFAVVAQEVKNLANQTSRATEDISAQIGAVQSATHEAVEAIRRISETINRVNEIAAAIASAVEEQGAATQEIARNVQEASAGTAEVSSNIAGVTQSASQTGQSANDVLGAAENLASQADQLRRQVDGFLADIKSA